MKKTEKTGYEFISNNKIESLITKTKSEKDEYEKIYSPVLDAILDVAMTTEHGSPEREVLRKLECIKANFSTILCNLESTISELEELKENQKGFNKAAKKYGFTIEEIK